MVTLLFEILKVIAAMAFFLCAIMTVGFLCRIKDLSFDAWSAHLKELVLGLVGNAAIIFLIVALIATPITSTAIHQLVGIHNLELKPDGEYCFYVKVSCSTDESYTLPAQIIKVTESFEAGEGKSVKQTKYYIRRVFLANGGYLDNKDGDPVKIGESCSYYDSKTEEELSFVLLNEHAYSPYVEETNNANWLNSILLVIKLALISFNLYALCHKNRSNNQQEDLANL